MNALLGMLILFICVSIIMLEGNGSGLHLVANVVPHQIAIDTIQDKRALPGMSGVS